MARHDRAPIDRDQVIAYLTRAFDSKASQKYGPRSRAVAGTDLHALQCDMAYLINEIGQGTESSAKHAITQANRLINSIGAEDGRDGAS